jgi:5,10-methylenetetrahydrofolate reductase
MIPFVNVLRKRPLIFSVVPIRDTRTGEKAHDDKILRNLDTRIKEFSDALTGKNRLNAVSVPELVEENHEGRPRYNSVYTRKLSGGIASNLDIDAIVNKVVVHLENYSELSGWIKETYSLGIRNMILVGGNTRHHRYPGPAVSEANVAAGHVAAINGLDDLTIGNICLPERRHEARAMLYKTMTGARFFTTQMLFDSQRIIELLGEYSALCNEAGVEPATVLLSFAPLRSVSDLNLLDFLGVDLPTEAREYILESGIPSEAPERSILNAVSIYSDVVDSIDRAGNPVPVGVNIEQLTKTNLPFSLRLLDRFADIIDKKGPELKETLDRKI